MMNDVSTGVVAKQPYAAATVGQLGQLHLPNRHMCLLVLTAAAIQSQAWLKRPKTKSLEASAIQCMQDSKNQA
jgi:hypothetical protein